MPFVVPQQQQPDRQKSTAAPSDHREYAPQPQPRSGRGGGMERRDYASQQPGPAYRPPQQQRGGGGYDPWQQQRQMQYRQPQQRQQYQPAPPPYRDPYGQRGGGRQYQQPQYQPPPQRGYDSYGRQPQRQYQPQYEPPIPQYSSRPQQGNYVGEGVYADGTPMPPEQLGVNTTPDVIGGVTPRAYYEEDETYNKPMRVGRGQGGLY